MNKTAGTQRGTFPSLQPHRAEHGCCGKAHGNATISIRVGVAAATEKAQVEAREMAPAEELHEAPRPPRAA